MIRNRIATLFFAVTLSAMSHGCNKESSTAPPDQEGPADTTPPATVSDLQIERTQSGVVTLRWTAPGDDGTTGTVSRYEIRYAADSLVVAAWDEAAAADSFPVPRSAGLIQRFQVGPLAHGAWYFGLKAADEATNWSPRSNVARALLADDIPPATITDLRVATVTENSVTLLWTAPGDDGISGHAARYDLRRASAPITGATWDAAVGIEGVPAPDSAGAEESFTVTGLESGQTHHFSVKAADEIPNWSAVSNSVPGVSIRRLTVSSAPFGASEADWSPDGRTIAFTDDRWGPEGEKRDEIYTMPVEGGEATRLTEESDGAFNPAWSPDGTRIAFVRLTGLLSDQEPSVMQAVAGAPPVPLAIHGQHAIGKPAWSPDGTRIAYCLRSEGDQPGEIRIVPATGGESVQVIGNLEVGGIDWFGDRIVYSAYQDGNYNIFWIPAAGGNPTRLTEGPGRGASLPDPPHSILSSRVMSAFPSASSRAK